MKVVHDEKRHTFEIVVEGKRSYLEYEIKTDAESEKMLFTHTFCDPSLRGKGIAAALVESGLSYARENGYDVEALCSYVAAYLERHPFVPNDVQSK